MTTTSAPTFPRPHEAQANADETRPPGSVLIAVVKRSDGSCVWAAVDRMLEQMTLPTGWVSCVRGFDGKWREFDSHESATDFIDLELGIIHVRHQMLKRATSEMDPRTAETAAHLAVVLTALRSEHDAFLEARR